MERQDAHGRPVGTARRDRGRTRNLRGGAIIIPDFTRDGVMPVSPSPSAPGDALGWLVWVAVPASAAALVWLALESRHGRKRRAIAAAVFLATVALATYFVWPVM